MNLRSKKQLAAKTFNVGKERIIFVNERLEEIKEAITKQDMRNLQKDGAIMIKEVKGRGKNFKVGGKKGMGNIRKNVNQRKKDYVILTRKLRKFVADKKEKGDIDRKKVKELREKIRNRVFKSKNQLKDYMGGLEDENTKKKKKRK